MIIYGLVWSSLVLVYHCNSLCSHVGEIYCKARNGLFVHSYVLPNVYYNWESKIVSRVYLVL